MVSSKSNLRATDMLRKGTTVVCRDRWSFSLESNAVWRKNLSSSRDITQCFLLKLLSDWMVYSYLIKDNLIYRKSSYLNVNCIYKNPFTATCRLYLSSQAWYQNHQVIQVHSTTLACLLIYKDKIVTNLGLSILKIIQNRHLQNLTKMCQRSQRCGWNNSCDIMSEKTHYYKICTILWYLVKLSTELLNWK